MNKKVSLITPVYNAMPWLKTYLSCLKEQTWRPLQFIVVDDDSDDGTYEYLQQIRPDLEQTGIEVCALRQAHAGQAAAMNMALPYVAGDYLTWCDADDRLTANSIERKVLYLESHPEIGLARSDGILTDWTQKGKSRLLSFPQDRVTQDIFDAAFRENTYCCAGCYMIRTSVFFECYPKRQIPLSPEGQNLQMVLPPASRSQCGFIPESLFFYDVRSTGHSSKSRSFTQQMERVANFYRLREEILPYCTCDQRYYQDVNKKIYEDKKHQILRHVAKTIREMK